MPQDLTDDKSTLVQVMAWCRQATSHYLNQCWPRSPMPYGVTRPQCVNSLWPSDDIWYHILVNIGLTNGLSPVQCQAITSTEAALSSTESTFNEILITLKSLKMLSANRWPFFRPQSVIPGGAGPIYLQISSLITTIPALDGVDPSAHTVWCGFFFFSFFFSKFLCKFDINFWVTFCGSYKAIQNSHHFVRAFGTVRVLHELPKLKTRRIITLYECLVMASYQMIFEFSQN